MARLTRKWLTTKVDHIDRAVSALREVANCRADLLAQHAGICLGFGETDFYASRYRLEADLCINGALTSPTCCTSTVRSVGRCIQR